MQYVDSLGIPIDLQGYHEGEREDFFVATMWDNVVSYGIKW